MRHDASYEKRLLGHSPIAGGGRFYGWTVTCSCGWSKRFNGPKKDAVEFFKDHLATQLTPEEAFVLAAATSGIPTSKMEPDVRKAFRSARTKLHGIAAQVLDKVPL